MKKRHIYSLLFGIPGLFIAGIISILVFGGLTGLLWIFVFGDDPWPAYIELVLPTFFVLSVLGLWILIIAAGYFLGKQLENDPVLNRTHVLLSASLTVLFLLLVVLQQWGVGNLGPRSNSLLCNDFCVQHGYSGSGMPMQISGDQTCSCYDSSGTEALQIPLDHLRPDFQK